MIRNYIYMTKIYFGLKSTNKKSIVILFIIYLLSTFANLLLPFFASRIVDFISRGDFTNSYINVCYLGLSYIAYIYLEKACYIIYQKNYNYTYNNMQEKVIEKVSEFDEQFTDNISKSYIINTTSEDISKSAGLYDYIFDTLCNLVYLIIAIIILLNVNLYIGIIVIILSIIYLYLDAKKTELRDNELMQQRKSQDKITDLFNEILDGNKEVRSFNINDKLNNHFDYIKKNWKKSYFSKRKYYDQKETILPILINIGEITIYVILLILLINNNIHLGALVLVIGYYKDIYDCNSNINNYYTELCSSFVRVKRLSKILNYVPSTNLKFGDNNKDDIFGNVEFNNVDFTYENSQILNNVSFKIQPNSLTAIVGKSGSGKSTIFKLLLRLYKPDKGNIYIDGIDIYDYTKEVYTSNVSVATQKPFVFNMSIRENLNFVDDNIENQIEACKKVGIHDFIMSLKDGYNTVLKENANNISGGQKQLISLARTLLSKSEILLFDEITSALDPNKTKEIIKVLKNFKRNHTVIMITHKPILMKHADNVIVIDKGKVVGNGKHNKLIKENQFYKRIQK